MSTTPSSLPLILPGIQTFPPEMILEILELLDPAEAIRAATACRQWHRAAIGNTAYWLSVCINQTDIEDPDVLQRVLYRSRCRPISLHLDFPLHNTAGALVNYDNLPRLLGDVVRGHLHRCRRLEVRAHETAWSWIRRAFAEETFPLVRSVFLLNSDVSPYWPIGDAFPVPPSNISFPLLDAQQLVHAELVGVSVGHAPFPNLRSLIIKHHFPDLVVDEGLNPWLFASATELSFEGMFVPVMSDTVGTPVPQPDSTVQTLVLRNLQATPTGTDDEDGISVEYDCSPFFAALPTSRLRYLIIDSWDLDGRIWDDFIASLPITNAKFPLVESLVLSRMDFQWMPYADVALFFAAFPALKRLSLPDCIWEEVIETLEMWPTLCPGLPQLWLNNGVILRDDQLPFRNYMFTYDLPVGDEDFQDDDYYHDL
ncbi:hypothetical protein B0H11DRAFT_45885 [Mycena galericulata]|nr:hypothetical protein B0H11DRAFT_45885 [Mycena galericulata]